MNRFYRLRFSKLKNIVTKEVDIQVKANKSCATSTPNHMLSVIIHPQDSKIIVLPIKDNEKTPIFYGILTLKKTPKGARVGKFRIHEEDKDDFRAPEELIELLRLADKILIAEGNEKSEAQFKELLSAYQLDQNAYIIENQITIRKTVR